MIKVLIVDDSQTETALLNEILSSEKRIQVIGTAKNGEEAVKLTSVLKPDLITMDVFMPVMNGVEATRIIMSQNPTPIVVISSAVSNDSLISTFQALEAGALSVIEKPNLNKQQYEKVRARIIDTVLSMSEIKVIKRRFATKKAPAKTKISIQSHQKNTYEIIAIGASIGGPQALKTILTELPSHFSVPIVVVQHMAKGFIKGFASYLNQHSALKIKDAEDHEELQSGTVYLAPDHHHLTIKRSNNKLVAHLIKGKPISGFCPSATVLLQSVAHVCGKNAIGVLLTGMGNDGAQGLLELKQAGSHTLIQDPKSSVVFGMGGVAYEIGAVDRIIELEDLAAYLQKIIKL